MKNKFIILSLFIFLLGFLLLAAPKLIKACALEWNRYTLSYSCSTYCPSGYTCNSSSGCNTCVATCTPSCSGRCGGAPNSCGTGYCYDACCTPSCAGAEYVCQGTTFDNGCGGTCSGTKVCITSTPTPTSSCGCTLGQTQDCPGGTQICVYSSSCGSTTVGVWGNCIVAPTPTPYCSTGVSEDCLSKGTFCEQNDTGGSCVAYCGDYDPYLTMDEYCAIFGKSCLPTSEGGTCIVSVCNASGLCNNPSDQTIDCGTDTTPVCGSVVDCDVTERKCTVLCAGTPCSDVCMSSSACTNNTCNLPESGNNVCGGCTSPGHCCPPCRRMVSKTMCTDVYGTYYRPDCGSPDDSCGTMCVGGADPTNTPTPVVPASCSITLSIATQIDLGSTTTAHASLLTGAVDYIRFTSQDTAVATINSPSTDGSVPFEAIVEGAGLGQTNIVAEGVVGGVVLCTAQSTYPIVVTTPGPWWQVQDSDVVSGGDLISLVPQLASTYFNIPPVYTPGFSGVNMYGASSSYDFSSNSDSGVAGDPSWIVSASNNAKTFDYAFFASSVPSEVTQNVIEPGTVDASEFTDTGKSTFDDGYTYYIHTGDLAINGDVAIPNGRKVILLVEGNLNINGNVSFTPGRGFFMAVVSGNITLDSAVTDLSGIYFANGTFSTGVGSVKLTTVGSIGANGGITLLRDLGNLNTTESAELFIYSPAIMATYPKTLAYRRILWKEVAP